MVLRQRLKMIQLTLKNIEKNSYTNMYLAADTAYRYLIIYSSIVLR